MLGWYFCGFKAKPRLKKSQVLVLDVDIIARHGTNVSNMVYWVDKIKSFPFRLKVSSGIIPHDYNIDPFA